MKAPAGKKLGVEVCDVEDVKAVVLPAGQLWWLLNSGVHHITQVASVKLPLLSTAQHLPCST